MKIIWHTLLTVIILLPLSIGEIAILSDGFSSEMDQVSNIEPTLPSVILEYSPFNITSDEDFVNQAWPGNGTQENPYVIQNLTIHANGTCLGVMNTTKHFIVAECAFFSEHEGRPTGMGILFSNVSNGVVIQSFFYEKQIGIFLSNVTHCTIENNVIQNCSIVDIHADTIKYCALINNKLACRNSLNAIYVYEGIYSTVVRNNITGFSKFESYGITVFRSNHTLIRANFVTNFSYGIQISGHSLRLSNNEIRECSSGISVFDSFHCWFEQNRIFNGDFGVEINSSNNCTLIWSVIAENTVGIILYGVYNCSINENYIVDNRWGLSFRHGYRGGSSGCSFIDNDFQNNGIIFEIAAASEWNHVFHGNTVNGKLFGYFNSISNIELNGYEYGQIILVNCSNIAVSEGVFHNSSVGITLTFCDGCSITNIVSSFNTYGILIKHSYNCSILNSETKFNIVGVHLRGLRTSSINSNRINNNTMGIEIMDSWYNLFTNNILYYNIAVGIALSEDTIGNSIYENSFGWNGQNAIDNGLNNTWDNGAGLGNSWSDYDGSGVYHIFGTAEATDNYPLLLTHTPSYPLYLLLLILPLGIIVWISIYHLTKYKSFSSDKGSKIKVPLRYVIISKLKKQKDTIKNRSKSDDEPES